MYPEYYRKTSDRIKGSNQETPEPFCIGYISGIFSECKEKILRQDQIHLHVTKLYRPENTHKDANAVHQLDLNLLYWSSEGDKNYWHQLLLFFFQSLSLLLNQTLFLCSYSN